MKKSALILCFMFISLFGEESLHKIELFFPNDTCAEMGYFLSTGEHRLIGKSSDGLIELEDGTQFKVISNDCARLEQWNFYDLITFSPNYSFYRQSEFYIINQESGESLRANIWASPAIENPQALRLHAIDREREEVVLSLKQGMHMRWKIDSGDFKKIDYWKIGDMIVIGKNVEYFFKWFSNHPYILVSYSATEKVLYLRGTPKPL